VGRANINRPVHLAIRDRYYGKFLDLLKFSFEGRPLNSRQRLIGTVAKALQAAYGGAQFALRGEEGTREERDFIRFLRLLLDSARTVEFLVRHEEILKEDTSFLKRFLHDNPQAVTDSTFFHRERAEQEMREIKLLASVAEGSYLALKQANFESLSADEQRRYLAMFGSDHE